MDILQLADYGVTFVALGAMVFIVIKFLKHIENKDKDFKELLGNHINHNTSILEKLDNAVRELVIWVKKSNGNK